MLRRDANLVLLFHLFEFFEWEGIYLHYTMLEYVSIYSIYNIGNAYSQVIIHFVVGCVTFIHSFIYSVQNDGLHTSYTCSRIRDTQFAVEWSPCTSIWRFKCIHSEIFSVLHIFYFVFHNLYLQMCIKILTNLCNCTKTMCL